MATDLKHQRELYLTFASTGINSDWLDFERSVRPYMAGIGSRIGLVSFDIEDAVANGLTHLYDAAISGGYDPSRSFSGWFHRVVVNPAIDQLRKNNSVTRRTIGNDPYIRCSNGEEVLIDVADFSGNPELIHAISRAGSILDQALDQLTTLQRTTVILSYVEGHDGYTAAKIMELHPSTYRAHLSEARKKNEKNIKKKLWSRIFRGFNTRFFYSLIISFSWNIGPTCNPMSS
ncbi:MAG: RNA polymerase sigma factor [Candidatus Aenigmatarchaeota archaeon]